MTPLAASSRETTRESISFAVALLAHPPRVSSPDVVRSTCEVLIEIPDFVQYDMLAVNNVAFLINLQRLAVDR